MARVLAWHARGHRFESGILHSSTQRFRRLTRQLHDEILHRQCSPQREELLVHRVKQPTERSHGKHEPVIPIQLSPPRTRGGRLRIRISLDGFNTVHGNSFLAGGGNESRSSTAEDVSGCNRRPRNCRGDATNPAVDCATEAAPLPRDRVNGHRFRIGETITQPSGAP